MGRTEKLHLGGGHTHLMGVRRVGQWRAKPSQVQKQEPRELQRKVMGPRHGMMCAEAFAALQMGKWRQIQLVGQSQDHSSMQHLLQTPWKGDAGHRGTPQPREMSDRNRDGPKSARPAKLDWHLG